jgi:hypothetical protein
MFARIPDFILFFVENLPSSIASGCWPEDVKNEKKIILSQSCSDFSISTGKKVKIMRQETRRLITL